MKAPHSNHTSTFSNGYIHGTTLADGVSRCKADRQCSGECAGHFRLILDKYPPQVSSRSAAAAWGCHVHNEVNKSLNKPLFDCSNIGDFYDCGCAEDEATDSGDKKIGAVTVEGTKSEKSTGDNFDEGLLTGDTPLKLEQEG